MNKFLKFSAAAWLFALLGTAAYAQQSAVRPVADFSIVPKPLSAAALPGKFVISKSTRIFTDPASTDLRAMAAELSDRLEALTGFRPAVAEGKAGTAANSIVLSLDRANKEIVAEGYQLKVLPARISIKGSTAAGVFYGLQTMYQLMPAKRALKGELAITGADIKDQPRFGWRGLMLDVGRYFYSPEFIKKYIDYLAMHKMNTFHWHLTEDHGWRIEIKKYPKLTEVASWRPGTQFDRFAKQIDNNPHWGFYTQEQIKDIVAYAKTKYVNVVPEIEMPGHVLASMVAYPELSCTGGPFKMPVEWGIQKEIYCAGNEKTFEFIEGVLSEVIALFPSPVIHIGGDEAPKDRWKACPKCQKRIKNEKLKDEHELQSYFITRVEKFLNSKGKSIIGWDEILEGGLAPNAAVMSWRGVKGGIEAAKQHHDVVMSPSTHMYLDYYQGEPYLEPSAISGFLTLEKVYSYEPIPEDFTPEQAKYIKGVQGNVWAEYIHSPAEAEYMAFPRAAAVAEIAWSDPKSKNWDDFKRRMENTYQHYAAANINYSKSAYNVMYEADIDTAAKKAKVTLKTNSYQPEIRYTLDGSEPKASSALYSAPLSLNTPVTIKAATFKGGKMLNKISVRSIVF
jgi:hexosaminidase